MKRKIYETPREQKIDQLIGLVAFPLVNVLLWLTFWLGYGLSELVASLLPWSELVASLLPWIVNGSVLSLAFIFRPHIGLGYIVSFGIITGVHTILGVFFVGACYISLVAASLPMFGEGREIMFFILFSILLLVGFVFLGWVGSIVFKSWWFSAEE